MKTLMKWLAVLLVAVWVLVACQSAENDSLTAVQSTEAPAEVSAAAAATVPAAAATVPAAAPPTDEPEPTPTDVEAVAKAATEEVVVEEPAAEEAVAEELPEERAAQVVNGYQNVRYTQFDGDLVGATGKPQLLNVYARW